MNCSYLAIHVHKSLFAQVCPVELKSQTKKSVFSVPNRAQLSAASVFLNNLLAKTTDGKVEKYQFNIFVYNPPCEVTALAIDCLCKYFEHTHTKKLTLVARANLSFIDTVRCEY
jgi:hypothetical protein